MLKIADFKLPPEGEHAVLRDFDHRPFSFFTQRSFVKKSLMEALQDELRHSMISNTLASSPPHEDLETWY